MARRTGGAWFYACWLSLVACGASEDVGDQKGSAGGSNQGGASDAVRASCEQSCQVFDQVTCGDGYTKASCVAKNCPEAVVSMLPAVCAEKAMADARCVGGLTWTCQGGRAVADESPCNATHAAILDCIDQNKPKQ